MFVRMRRRRLRLFEGALSAGKLLEGGLLVGEDGTDFCWVVVR